MKKVLNILSYTLNVFFIIVLVIGLNRSGHSSGDPLALEEISRGIIDRENAELPLKIQGFNKVHNITIDSLVFVNKNVQPYSGYLVTQWDMDEKQNLNLDQYAANHYQDKYVRKTKTILVPVNDITITGNEYHWKTDWKGAEWDSKK